MTGRLSLVGTCMLAAALAQSPRPAQAEAQEIRLAKQFSMGYVQFNIIEHRHLIERGARCLAAHQGIEGLGVLRGNVDKIERRRPPRQRRGELLAQIGIDLKDGDEQRQAEA